MGDDLWLVIEKSRLDGLLVCAEMKFFCINEIFLQVLFASKKALVSISINLFPFSTFLPIF